MEEKIEGRRPAKGIREMEDFKIGGLEMVFYENETFRGFLY